MPAVPAPEVPQTQVHERAPAKINLCLHVTGRRADGYHELDTLVAFADIGDEISAASARGATSLRVSCRNMPAFDDGTLPVVPAGTDNLAWRALAMAGSGRGGIAGIELILEKRLPAGAGLGGGSSDAAAVLRAVARMHADPMPPAAAAVALGADVPMCLQPRPWRAQGIGEILSPVTLGRDLSAVLVWPGRPVATPAVFQAHAGRLGEPIPQAAIAALARDPVSVLSGLRNDLTQAAGAVEPVIADALAAVASLAGCRLARMSGSGSAVFGLFDDPAAARHAAARLSGIRPRWWVRATTLLAGTVATGEPARGRGTT